MIRLLLMMVFIGNTAVMAQQWYPVQISKASKIAVLTTDTNINTLKQSILNALLFNGYPVQFSANEGVSISTATKSINAAQQKISVMAFKTDSGYLAVFSANYILGTNTLFSGMGNETTNKGMEGSVINKCWVDLQTTIALIPGRYYYYLSS